MMMSKFDSGKKSGEDSSNGKLLHEIEAISKALYLDKNPPRSSVSSGLRSLGKTHLYDGKSKSKNASEDLSQKDKKSFWNWKPLKALSHIRNRRFNCCFSLQVHSIEGLPPNFNDLNLCVYWKRRDEELQTRPAKVFQGVAEFEEKLTHSCSVYGSRNGPHHSAKYEAKHFLLYASVSGAAETDLGKHRVDLTRLLPLTLEELEEEKSSGKWTTSYKLSGKARGAVLNVSFGYSVIPDKPVTSSHNQNTHELLKFKHNSTSTVKTVPKFDQGDGRSTIRRTGSLPGNTIQRARTRSVEDIKVLHEVLPISKSELSSSISLLYAKLDEEKLNTSVDYTPELDVFTEDIETLKPSNDSLADTTDKECMEKEFEEKEFEENEFSVIEQGIELSSNEQVKPNEVTKDDADDNGFKRTELEKIDGGIGSGMTLEEEIKLQLRDEDHVVNGSNSKEKENTKELLLEELELAFKSMSILETTGLGSPEAESEDEESSKCKDGAVISEFSSKFGVNSSGETVTEVDSAFNSAGILESPRFENTVAKSMYKSSSFDDSDCVASEFLNMLGIDHSPFGLSSESEPDSPRERLLRQFEKDALAGGRSLFDFDTGDVDDVGFGYEAPSGSTWGKLSDFDLSSAVKAAEEELYIDTEAVKSKTSVAMLEDLETEALMREWGLNEKSFQRSPPSSAGGFGSPIDFPPEEPLSLPPLGEGLGPFVQTNDGGFLRSMNPVLFNSAKSGGSLIMQVSSPVVVPAEMGSGVMQILQNLASVGIEKLSMQAKKLMPLEDITGKTMQQIAWEAAAPSLEAPESHRQGLLQHKSEVALEPPGKQRRAKSRSSGPRSSNFNPGSIGNELDSEYVSLEDLAPLAMDKIEALSIEGLRIQSGMSHEEAPSNISSQSIGEISALEGKRVNISGSLGLEGTGGLQLLDVKDGTTDEVDGLMGLSLTLDEWMRLDSGDLDEDDDQISERTSKILAAHHATSLHVIRGGSKGEKRRGKGSKKCGLLGNNFTVALMVQLRDPLRNYEPVGTPMLALIQVERVFVPPKPKIYSTVSEIWSNGNRENDNESRVVITETKEEKVEEALVGKKEQEQEQEPVAQFKITEVHVAGLKTEPGKKVWGSTTQKEQSGSRWLLAHGMGKSNKNPFLKSKPKAVAKTTSTPAATTTMVLPGDTLWSMSSRVGAKWKELAALNPHIRNPNVILPNEKRRLK